LVFINLGDFLVFPWLSSTVIFYTSARKMAKTKQPWETTREPNLLRNTASGRYYGRFTLSGKQKWVNLETDVWTVAKLRLADERAKIERLRQSATDVSSGDASVGSLVMLYRQRIADRVDIRPETRRRLREEVDAIIKTWPGFEGLAPRQLTRQSVTEWRNRLKRDGTGHRAPGAKAANPKNNGSSASLINKCIDALRRILDIAVERGQMVGNPLYPRGLKLKNTPRKPHLPEASKISEIFAKMEQGGGRFSRPAADLCRFLAYTGCRISEARAITWVDVDFKRGILNVHGEKTEAADRELPLIPAAKALLERLHLAQKFSPDVQKTIDGDVDPRGPVLAVGEAEKSLSRACKELGVVRLTHHDLRDAFATSAIEAGVDIPTVAAWLGHADGGAVLMRVYSHHRRAHSIAQAAKVMAGT
jgi:integrase